MRVLITTFLVMFMYGVLCNYIGAGLIALVAAGFTAWADKRLEYNRKQYEDNMLPPTTLHKLDEHDCQCYSSKF